MKLHPDQKIARAAARIIQKQGKATFTFGCDGGPRCIVGAIAQHMRLDPTHIKVWNAARRISVRLGLSPLFVDASITFFSDHNSKQKVVKTLMECP